MEVTDPITSHDDNLGLNPSFNQKYQNRERGRVGSQLQVGQIEQDLKPPFLGVSPHAAEGAPILGHDNMMESGNARTIALRRLYARNGAEHYRQWLMEHAHLFGIDPNQIAQMQAPMLVRRRMTDMNEEQRQQFVREANEPTVAAMSAAEIARSDAAILQDLDILQFFFANDRGVISSSDNVTFIQKFMENVVGPTERNRFQTSKGLLNQDGERRIRNALFALAYGDSAALERMAESTDDNSRNITGSMTMMAARLASINKEIALGNLYDLNITDEIAQAADIMQNLKDMGQSVESFLAQQKLFTDVDPIVGEVLRVFSQYARSRVKMTATFNAYADALEAVGNPRQMELLGKVDVTKLELMQAALVTMERTYGKGTEPTPADVRQGEAPSGEVAPEPDGTEEDFGLTGGKPKATSLEKRLKEVQKYFPDIDPDKAMTVLRAFPEGQIEPFQVDILVSDPELFDKVARGNLSAQEKEQLAKSISEGKQGTLPGLDEGGGDLFTPPSGPPAIPKSNLEILAASPPGAWQSFDKAFTDEEMTLLEKAIDAKLVQVKQMGGKTVYGVIGDLGTWLADQKVKPTGGKRPDDAWIEDALKAVNKYVVKGREIHSVTLINQDGNRYTFRRQQSGEYKVDGTGETFNSYEEAIRNAGPGEWKVESTVNVPPKAVPKAKPATLDAAFSDVLDAAMEHPNPTAITAKDMTTIAKRTLGLTDADLAETGGLLSRKKEIEEAFEFALVKKAREIVAGGVDVFEQFKKLYGLQPILTSRTSTSIANQAYSTPAPLAYLMNQWAGVTPESWVYDPTGGNGMLLVGTNPKRGWANEIDPTRAANLKAQGFNTTSQDAKDLTGTPNGPQEGSVDVVVVNSPFGNLEKPVGFDGYKIQKLEHQISLDALKAMDDDGRAVLILGGHSFFTPWGAPLAKQTESDRVFFNYLYSRYNVTHHINVDGKVYERMGTKFPIRLITIEGRKAEADKSPGPTGLKQIEIAKSFDDVYTLLKGDIDNAGAVAPRIPKGQPASPGGLGGAPTVEAGPAPEPVPVPGSVEGQGPGPAGQTEAGGGVRGPVGPGPRPPGGGPVRPGGRGGASGSPPVTPDVRGPTGPPVVPPAPKPGKQGTPSGPLQPGPAPGPAGTGNQTIGVSPKSVVSGTQIRLPDGTIVTIKEEAATYETAPEQTVEVVDADGNVRQIPISQIQSVIDKSGREVQLTDEDRKGLRVFQKGQQVETNKGVTGPITKIRGWGDEAEITVQGPDGKVTVSPADLTIVPEKTTDIIGTPPGVSPPPPGTPKETELQVNYQPTSKGRPMNTVAPRYMAEAVRNYLQQLQEQIGDIDDFVLDRLGYESQEALFSVLGAEQIEGVALAIDAIERGTGGFVIGHQTGVGGAGWWRPSCATPRKKD